MASSFYDHVCDDGSGYIIFITVVFQVSIVDNYAIHVRILVLDQNAPVEDVDAIVAGDVIVIGYHYGYCNRSTSSWVCRYSFPFMGNSFVLAVSFLIHILHLGRSYVYGDSYGFSFIPYSIYDGEVIYAYS